MWRKNNIRIVVKDWEKKNKVTTLILSEEKINNYINNPSQFEEIHIPVMKIEQKKNSLTLFKRSISFIPGLKLCSRIINKKILTTPNKLITKNIKQIECAMTFEQFTSQSALLDLK